MGLFTKPKKIGQIPVWMLFGFFAQSLTTETVCTTALVSLTNDFAISSDLAQLSSSIYFLGFALGILTLGPLSDRIGRRPVMFFGLSVYIIANCFCVLSTDIYFFITSRFFQALGASVGSVIAQAMARDSYRGSELSYVYATISLSLAFVPSLGATLGGFMVQYLGWRYNFSFLLCIGSVMLFLSYSQLPETNSFLRSEYREKYSSIFKVVITDKLVWLHALIVGCYAGLMFGFYLEAPFVFIDLLQISPSKYGMLTTAMTLSAFAGGMLSRWCVKRGVDSIALIRRGLILSTTGCGILFISSKTLPYLGLAKYSSAIMLLIPMMMQSMSHAIVMPLVLRFALEDYAKVNGTAGSIFGGGYYGLVALINFSISKLHAKSYTLVMLLFFVLSISTNIAFYYIRKLRQQIKPKPIFAED